MSTQASTERHKRWRSATNKRRVDLWIEANLYDALVGQAKAAGKPLAEWIRELLTRGIKRLPSTHATVVSPIPPRLPSTSGKGARQGEAERRAILTQQALVLRREGLSWQRIAQQWNAEQVPTLRGGRWDPATVRMLVVRSGKQPLAG